MKAERAWAASVFLQKKKKITFLRRAWKAGGQILASDLQDDGVYSSMEYIYIYIYYSLFPFPTPPVSTPGSELPPRWTDGRTDGQMVCSRFEVFPQTDALLQENNVVSG